MKKEKIEPFIRINSRITKEQHAFLKAYAKKRKKTEGEIHRLIIQTFIRNTQ